MVKSSKKLLKDEGGYMTGHHDGELKKLEDHMRKKDHHYC